MKKIKTLCAVCAMAMCFSTLSVTASAEETSGGAALTREQCNKIVETAIEEYHIVVPDMEEYKAYIWDMAKESGLTANAVETQFQADFGKAAERKKLNEKRAADVYINSAEEAMAALDKCRKTHGIQFGRRTVCGESRLFGRVTTGQRGVQRKSRT